MGIRDEMMLLVQDATHLPAPIPERANLCRDLGFGSLDFVNFLVGIEATYSIRFDLVEMVACLQLDQLISLVEYKVRERDNYA